MGFGAVAREVPALDHRIHQPVAADRSEGGSRGRALTHRDDDERRPDGQAPADEITGAEAEDTPPSTPVPATWAGRQRTSPEEAGEHDQVQADEPEADESEAEEPEAEEEP